MTHELQACIFVTVAWLAYAGWLIHRSQERELAGLLDLTVAFFGSMVVGVVVWVVYALGIYNAWTGEKGTLEFAKTDGCVIYSVKLREGVYSKVLQTADVRNPGLQTNKEVIVETNHNLYGFKKESRVKSLNGQVLFE